MKDTQWPQYEVFHQDRPGRPHRSLGTVHAPDAEMAMLNGRDLFVRRGECHSLWVAPASAIFARTVEELEVKAEQPTTASVPSSTPQEYLVFVKKSQRRAMSYVQHVGSVQASSPADAMSQATATFSPRSPYVWWVCPASAIFRSEAQDIESMFAPAEDKIYRNPNQYRTVAEMRKVKSSSRKRSVQDGLDDR